MLIPHPDYPTPVEMAPADYHAMVGGAKGELSRFMTSTQIKRIRENPAKWLLDDTEAKPTPNMVFGSLVDCLLLTPGRFDSLFAVEPETYIGTPKRVADEPPVKPWNNNANTCKAWAKEQLEAGRQPINRYLFNDSARAVKMAKRDPEIAALLDGARTSVAVFAVWADPATELSIPIRCLLDIVPTDPLELADLKCVSSAELKGWPRYVNEYGLHIQAALYADCFNVSTGERRDLFKWPLIEQAAPYMTGRRYASPDFLELGRVAYQAALAEYCQCLASGEWPGYDDRGGVQYRGWTRTEPEPWMEG